MGILEIKAPDGSMQKARIAGDTPTEEEIEAIKNYFLQEEPAPQLGQVRSVQDISGDFGGGQQQSVFKGFASEDVDTETGIQRAGFRAELSLAETDADQVLVLKKYGLDESDFLRDNRGRLAVTPEGAAKLGVDANKLTLIDEEGFSRNDISDLAGIAPEIIGGVAGAITGQIAIPIPILGAAIGAGVGAGGGQAAEEIFETVRGTQAQSSSEILKDVGTEAAIGFLADATFGLLGGAIRKVKGGVKPGKGLTDEELKTIGESLEMGLTPTLAAIKAPSLVARQQIMTICNLYLLDLEQGLALAQMKKLAKFLSTQLARKLKPLKLLKGKLKSLL
jgi:hypothetical protein